MPFAFKAGLMALAAIPLVSAVPPALATCSAPKAVSSTVKTPNSTYYSDGMPPARFQGNARAVVDFSAQDRINDVCGVAPCNMLTLGCQTPTALILPNPCTYGATDRYAKLLCHELAHINGWPATHGD